jgi:hypothetical protein
MGHEQAEQHTHKEGMRWSEGISGADLEKFTFFTNPNVYMICIGYSFNAGGMECRWSK